MSQVVLPSIPAHIRPHITPTTLLILCRSNTGMILQCLCYSPPIGSVQGGKQELVESLCNVQCTELVGSTMYIVHLILLHITQCTQCTHHCTLLHSANNCSPFCFAVQYFEVCTSYFAAQYFVLLCSILKFVHLIFLHTTEEAMRDGLCA